MSYCRWSSDDFRCDLYCYEHCDGGFITHVATRRREWSPWLSPYSIPALKSLSTDRGSEVNKRWKEVYEVYHRALGDVELHPIGLPYDGKFFNDDTLEDMRDRILFLREIGYRVPQDVIDRINEEVDDARRIIADGTVVER